MKIPLIILCQAGCGRELELGVGYVEALKSGDDVLFICEICAQEQNLEKDWQRWPVPRYIM